MRDNLPAMHGELFALPDHRILALEGPDAARFAHAQFMNDVAALADGHWQWNGWLSPKGRVLALFALLRLTAQSLWLLLPDTDPEDLRQSLQRFVFRSKVTLTCRPDQHVSGGFSPPDEASGTRLSRDVHVELDLGTASAPRALRISDSPAIPDLDAAASWKEYDLRHGFPRLELSQAETWTPQQLSLDRLQAYSVKKGCYPGQEIVARTHFLGQAKRGLALFETNVEIAVGTDVMYGERTVATVVSSAWCNDHCLLLVVLPLDANAGELRAAGVKLTQLPLLDGLAR